MSSKNKSKHKNYQNVFILPASQAWSFKNGKQKLNKNLYTFIGKVEKDTPGVILKVYSKDDNVKSKRKFYDDFSAMTDVLKTNVIDYLYEKPIVNGKPCKNRKEKVYLVEHKKSNNSSSFTSSKNARK